MFLRGWLTGWLEGLQIEVDEWDVMADLDAFPAGELEFVLPEPDFAVV